MSKSLHAAMVFWRQHFGTDLPEEVENELLALKLLGVAASKGDTNPELLAWAAEQMVAHAMALFRDGEHPSLVEYTRLRATGVGKEEAIREMRTRRSRVSEAFDSIFFRLIVEQLEKEDPQAQ